MLRGLCPRASSSVNASVIRGRAFSSHGSCQSDWKVIIGVEVHAQILSRLKLFSYVPTSKYGVTANDFSDVVDAAFPGSLPRLNTRCVELAVRAASALGAQIQRLSSFDRKHYFYSDLPSGYQITQRYAPIAKNGQLLLEKSGKIINITQIQLEQDTAKSTFDPDLEVSTIDLNRAGMGLLEIVSGPELHSPEQAAEYVRTLQAMLRFVGTSDGNMDEGSFRCDVNVSVNRAGESPGTRCEVKNLNSIKFLTTALYSEIHRHKKLLDEGMRVVQETRGFDERTCETYRLRSKEDTPEYRYMPDPNLPPLILDEAFVENIVRSLPELPAATRSRLRSQGLPDRDISALLSIDNSGDRAKHGLLDSSAVHLFDAVSNNRDAKMVLNWIAYELYGIMVATKRPFRDNTVSGEQMGALIDMIQSGKLTVTSARSLLRHMVNSRTTALPFEIADNLSLLAWGDKYDELTVACQKAIEALPGEADAVRGGNIKVMNKLVGYVMRLSCGRADALAVRDTLKRLCDES